MQFSIKKPNNKFTKSFAINMTIAIAVLAPLLAGVLFLRVNVKDSTSQILSARQEIRKRTETLTTLTALRQEFNNFGEKYLSILHNVIPQKDRLINISQEFQTLARAENVDFGFSFLREVLPEASILGLGFVEFRLNIVGEDLDKISKFIKKLESFHYLTTVENVNVTGSANETQATIITRVYFR